MKQPTIIKAVNKTPAEEHGLPAVSKNAVVPQVERAPAQAEKPPARGKQPEPQKSTDVPLLNEEKPPVTAEAEMLSPRLSRKVAEKVDKASLLPAFAAMSTARKPDLASPSKVQSSQDKHVETAKAEPAGNEKRAAPDNRTGKASDRRPHQLQPGAIIQGQRSSARGTKATLAAPAAPAGSAFRTSGASPYPASLEKGKAAAGSDSGPPLAAANKGTIAAPASRPGPGIAPDGAGSIRTDTAITAGTAKPVAGLAEKPKALFHPSITGDLKLVITGEGDYKVGASFREFSTSRRSKPFTYREARNSRGVAVKTVRTREKVMEAVVESTEEGVYDLKLMPGDGTGAKVSLVLKIHETGPGARTKNLGSRPLNGDPLLVRVLMPEGILWDDEGSFTGNMEDSDSVTKFNADSGLVWKEYK